MEPWAKEIPPVSEVGGRYGQKGTDVLPSEPEPPRRRTDFAALREQGYDIEDVEVEDARCPTLAGAAAELPLDVVQFAEDSVRVLIAFYQGHGIGKVAPGAVGCDRHPSPRAAAASELRQRSDTTM